MHLFPVSGGGGDNRFEVNGLHDLFVQVLLHGCQLMTMATTSGTAKLRAMVITRIGSFFELECQGNPGVGSVLLMEACNNC